MRKAIAFRGRSEHGTPCPYRGCCEITRAGTKPIVQGQKRTASVCPKRLIQLSAVGEVFLEGTCPLSRRPQTAKCSVPMLPGTRRRWVRKATAFRGRSEQDRSALCPACSTATLKTFRWNVFNGIFLATKTPDTARRVPTEDCRLFSVPLGIRLQCPTGTLQKSSLSSPVSHGERSCSLPAKSYRFLSLSPRARSMAQGISLSADSDLEGTCPLRTPRQLRSAGAA